MISNNISKIMLINMKSCLIKTHISVARKNIHTITLSKFSFSMPI